MHDDPSEPLEDKMGHKIYDGVRFVVGRYLEFSSFNNKCHIYKVSNTKAFFLTVSILLPYVHVLETTKTCIKILLLNFKFTVLYDFDILSTTHLI